jgi:hypothetical protein
MKLKSRKRLADDPDALQEEARLDAERYRDLTSNGDSREGSGEASRAPFSHQKVSWVSPQEVFAPSINRQQ